MMRTVGISTWRSANANTTRRPRVVRPGRMNRSSPTEWMGSGIVITRSSSNAVVASSKLTRCRRRFRRAFSGSHSKRRAMSSIYAGVVCIRLTPKFSCKRVKQEANAQHSQILRSPGTGSVRQAADATIQPNPSQSGQIILSANHPAPEHRRQSMHRLIEPAATRPQQALVRPRPCWRFAFSSA